jgi:hypothetical protein
MARARVIRLDMGGSVGRLPNTTTCALVDLPEDVVRDLAEGRVPRLLRAMAMGCLEWHDEDERRARRPPAKARKAG